MRKRLMVSLIACFALAAAAPAMAQIPQSDCQLGVYADAEGTVSTFLPTQGQEFDVYVVMFLEGLTDAVAYDLLVPELGQEIFLIGTEWGPGGGGFNITTAGGYNVGLGECAVGLGGQPILVAKHTFIMPNETQSARTIWVAPNTDYDPNAPFFNVCTAQLFPCTISTPLLLEAPVGTEATSFGSIKALY